MNQPQNPVPPRGDRPQLFKAPGATKANAKRHADFGPSILATIDGGQARFTVSRDRSPARRVLWMGALALLVAATYVGVKFNASRVAAAPDVVVARAPVPVVVKAVEVPASAPQVAAVQGAAAIETVASVLVPLAAASAPASNMAASLNSIQLALDRSEPAPAVKEKVATKEAVKHRGAAPASPASTRTASKTAPASEIADADLLAAMLPHLKRGVVAPSSPAYEKRCGQSTGEAAVDCRAKFCNGRQGVDAACPAVPAQR
ncbi:MAG: hypothetical protein H7Y33_02190 [Cytophagales bacterium]|nr:hypothetical protein [Rhizobacter sp.]